MMCQESFKPDETGQMTKPTKRKKEHPPGTILFSDWATEWLETQASAQQDIVVTQQDIQSLRKQVYVRLDALLGTNAEKWDAILPLEKSELKEIESQIKKTNEKIDRDIETLKRGKERLERNNSKLDPEELKRALNKKDNKIEAAEEKKKHLQSHLHDLHHVRLYDWMFPEEIAFFEYLLSTFSDRKGLEQLKKSGLESELEYGVRLEIIYLLMDIVREIPNCSTYYLMGSTCSIGNTYFGSWSDEPPAEIALRRLAEKFLIKDIYRLRPVLDKLSYTHSLLCDLKGCCIDEQEKNKFPEHEPSGFFDEEFWSIVAELDLALQNTQEKLERKYDHLFDDKISPKVVRRYNKKQIQQVNDWQNRSLEKVYPFVFMNAVQYKIKEYRREVTKTVCVALGITKGGTKDVLGMWISEHKSDKFQLNVLNDLKKRGVLDVYLFCTDSLCDMKQAVQTVYPKSRFYQIRSSTRSVNYDDMNRLIPDLEKIYTADTLDNAKKILVS